MNGETAPEVDLRPTTDADAFREGEEFRIVRSDWRRPTSIGLRGGIDVAIWSTRARRGIVGILAGLACIVLLSDCTSIAVATLKAIYANPNTKVRAYDMRIDVSFRLGNEVVRSVRYGEVYYLDGKGDGYRYGPCDKSKKFCWAITPEYFVILANGDIVSVHLDTDQLVLRDMRPGDSVRAKGTLFGIYRNHPTAHGKGLVCLNLSDADMGKFYGLPPRRHGGEMAGLDIDIVATRVADTDGRHRVLDPVEIYETSPSEHPCENWAKRVPAEPTVQ